MFQKTLTRGHCNESNYPVQERKGGGRSFEGGVLEGHYGTCSHSTKYIHVHTHAHNDTAGAQELPKAAKERQTSTDML